MKIIFLDIDGVLNYNGCKTLTSSGSLFVNDNKIKMFKEMQQFADSQYHYLFNELIRIEKKRESCL